MNPDKVVFTKSKDGTYCIQTTHIHSNRTTVMENYRCDVKWKDSVLGIPESVTFLSNMASGAIYYKEDTND